TQLLTDLPDRHRTAFVSEGSGARNDEAPYEPTRHVGDKAVDDAVDEVIYAGIARQVQKRQDHDQTNAAEWMAKRPARDDALRLLFSEPAAPGSRAIRSGDRQQRSDIDDRY